MCVHSVLMPSEEDAAGKRFDLKALLTPPLWTLSRNLGIANCGSKNKFECRRAMIAAIFSYQEKLETNELGPRSHAGDLTSTICRAVSVVLSNQFIESFKTVNDTKTRRDHETNSTNKHFWINAALAQNDCGGCDRIQLSSHSTTATVAAANKDNSAAHSCTNKDASSSSCHNNKAYCHSENAPIDDIRGAAFDSAEFDSFLSLFIPESGESRASDPQLQELAEDPEINLLAVNQFDTDAFRKKITDLFQVCLIMKENMTACGTHDSNLWDFVEAPMNTAKKHFFTKLGVYYFHVRCNEHPDLYS